VDAEPLLLDSDMPERINHQLWRRRWATIPDIAGNEPVFARVIFESLAERYAAALSSLENLLGRPLDRIHILGGASRNKLLTELTEKRTRRPVEIGHPESSTIGNLAVQLAASEAEGGAIAPDSIAGWAARLCRC
jgi:rhamnulokinase